jgi:hypothetical protein
MSTLNEEVLDPAEEVQNAYDKATVSNWTIARHSAAMSMGATILSGVFGPELKSLQETGAYPNALRDVVIVLWLCSLSAEEVIKINSRLNLERNTADAYAWAEAEGIKYGSKKYLDGVRTLTEIVGGIFSSFYAVDSKPEIVRKNVSSPHGKLASPTTRSKPAGKRKAS